MKKLLLIPALLIVSLYGDLKIMTEDFPPYNYSKDGKIKGLCSRVVQSIQQKVKDRTPIEVKSWSIAYEALLHDKDTALFCTVRNEKRENLFKWVGPIAYSNLVFQESTLHPTGIKTLEDAKKVAKIGVIRNDSSYQYLAGQGFDNFVFFNNDTDMYEALNEGVINLTTGNEISLPLRLKEIGLPKKSIRNTAVVIYRKGMYVAFSKDVSDGLIAKWQDALDTLKASGDYEKIRLEALQETYKDY